MPIRPSNPSKAFVCRQIRIGFVLARRSATVFLILLIGVGVQIGSSQAQTFPERTIKIVIGGPAGSAYDIIARRLAPHLGQTLGQPVVVDNKPGAGGNLAAEQVALAPPDGYTLTIGGPQETGVARTLGSPYVDVEALFMPVALVAEGAWTLMANAALGIKNMDDLMQHLKQRNKPIDFAIGPLYSGTHAISVAISQVTGNHPFNIVPYKVPSAALPDLANGVVSLGFATATEAATYLQGGKIVALGTFAPRRIPMFPDVQTMVEQGLPSLNLSGYGVVLVHRDVPEAIQRTLHEAFRKASLLPEVQERLRAGGSVYHDLSLEETRRYLKERLAFWNRVAKDSGLKYVP